jgi:hypothetical protein
MPFAVELFAVAEKLSGKRYGFVQLFLFCQPQDFFIDFFPFAFVWFSVKQPHYFLNNSIVI